MKSLEEQSHELIKAHILDPKNSPLPVGQQEELDRIISISRVPDKNPQMNNAVMIHMSKYSQISKSTAYWNARVAMRLYVQKIWKKSSLNISLYISNTIMNFALLSIV